MFKSLLRGRDTKKVNSVVILKLRLCGPMDRERGRRGGGGVGHGDMYARSSKFLIVHAARLPPEFGNIAVDRDSALI